MPELPEVEIVKKSLDRKIKNKKIIKVVVRNRNLRIKIPTNFDKFLEKKVIKKVTRFSKYLILNFSNETYCLIHLGMTGTIHIVEKNHINKITNLSFYSYINLPKKHNHVEMIFKNFRIIYNDPRRFGFFKIIKNSDNLKKKFTKLGPEPFSKRFNLSYVLKYFLGKKKDIKSFLLDQIFVSGIGNIYANEILYFCKINPKKSVKDLTSNECKNIIFYSKYVLNKAISKGGSSIRDFKNTSGSSGSFQKEFKVYQRDKLNCFRQSCKGKIRRETISNRSTFFCNTCQK
mgnify:FL=1